jgi:predicted Zn-dependent peptidase
MIHTLQIAPGAVLRCCRDTRFKQGCLSFQFVRPMDERENHLNALLPSVMLRATVPHPDLRAITRHLDDLYGASIGPLVRRLGDRQTTGFYMSFLDDRFAMAGDRVAAGMIAFLEEVLTQSPLEEGGFLQPIMDSEKRNLISTIESELNDKGSYAMGRLLKNMCRGDAFGLPRLGEKEDVAKITPQGLYDHYLRIRRESPIEIFYVGSMVAEEIAALLQPMLESWERAPITLPPQTGLTAGESSHVTEAMEVSQGKLCLGFTTPITNRRADYAAMVVMNNIFGAGMTSKLFVNVREKLSLCYSIGASYYGSKGIMTVGAGIDFDKEEKTRQEILNQLEACRRGEITPEELNAVKEAIRSGIRAAHDSPGSIEGYYSTSAIYETAMNPEQYLRAVEAVTVEDVAKAAQQVTCHSSFFLKGAEA